ncbi:CrcB family protein [Ornithinimicrobium sp. W1679]|uniref:CrcB family protein n=1 Tax=unclassified Ornithinimicrobium TaxID=2615080 RepID=UPI003CF58308
MTPWVGVLAVAAGGAAGAVARWVLARWLGEGGGLVLANVLGSAALTALVLRAGSWPPALLLLLATGVCGALTSWSTLVAQVWWAAVQGRWRAVLAVLGGSLGGGLAAVLLTWWSLRR